MSTIPRAFNKDKSFIGFVTAGDPGIAESKEFILEMVRSGADLVEIGIPFSDPIAEGPVIQRANIRALKSGTTVEKVFTLAADVRNETAVPLVFLTYLNPVFHFGYDAFFARCAETGVDGIIIPDLPFEEQQEVKIVAASYGVDLISLIAPTSAERAVKIAENAAGFLYLVSSLGVTGTRDTIETDLAAIVAAVKPASPVPIAVGFGINTPAQAAAIGQYADAIIVGSAIVKIIEEYGPGAAPHIYSYIKTMKNAINGR